MPNRILTITTTCIIALILGGCGTTYYVHDYKDEKDFYRDKNICIQEANAAYPVKRSQPAYTGSTTNCYGFGYSVNCTTTPQPNYFANVDWNSGPRDNYKHECMLGKGWAQSEK